MKKLLISEVFPDVIGSSQNTYFFAQLVGIVNSEATPHTAYGLALDYFVNRSGSKLCSPFLIRLLGNSDIVTQGISDAIYSVLEEHFGDNWRKLYSTIIAEYNPIHNYDVVETIHRDLQGENKATNTGELTDTTKQDSTMGADEFVYGFNSESEQPSNKRTVTSNATTTNTQNGTLTDNGTNHDVEDITKTRSGNIGVTTSQQMLQQERELWRWNFVEQMFKDIDSVLTLKVYDTCRV